MPYVCTRVCRNPGAVALRVVRTEGLRGMYRGFVSNASRNTPGEMVFFATYEQSRHLMKQSGQVKDDIGMRHVYAGVFSRYSMLDVERQSPVWHSCISIAVRNVSFLR